MFSGFVGVEHWPDIHRDSTNERDASRKRRPTRIVAPLDTLRGPAAVRARQSTWRRQTEDVWWPPLSSGSRR